MSALNAKPERGSRPGERRGGRQVGTPNSKTVDRQAALARAFAGGMTPIEVIAKVMHGDTTITDRQLQAAGLAAPYVHSRLANTVVTAEITGKAGGPIVTVDLGTRDPIEAAKAYAQIMGGS